VSNKQRVFSIDRRSMLGAAAAALGMGSMGSRAALAQTRAEALKGEKNHSASNPGPINQALAAMNPNSNNPRLPIAV
jgi:oxalate decarboxylase